MSISKEKLINLKRSFINDDVKRECIMHIVVKDLTDAEEILRATGIIDYHLSSFSDLYYLYLKDWDLYDNVKLNIATADQLKIDDFAKGNMYITFEIPIDEIEKGECISWNSTQIVRSLKYFEED